MISFRYHIVSIVSVFLALAVGVALGGGPLKGEVDNSLVEQVEADRKAKAELRAEIAALRSTDEFSDEFARSVSPGLIAGSLQDRPVTLVVLPGAGQDEVAELTEFIGEAGGSVGGTVRVGEGMVDATQKQLVDELGSQLLDGTSDVTVADDAGGYERLGALLARAIATDEDRGAPVDDAANSILSGLSTANLVSPTEDMTRRGSLVVVIAGASAGDVDPKGAGAIVTSLVRAMDGATDGVVVTGPTAAARAGGVIDAIRRDVVTAKEVSTVDVIGRASGQVVSVMALAEQTGGAAGHYGAIDAADGAMPAVPGGS